MTSSKLLISKCLCIFLLIRYGWSAVAQWKGVESIKVAGLDLTQSFKAKVYNKDIKSLVISFPIIPIQIYPLEACEFLKVSVCDENNLVYMDKDMISSSAGWVPWELEISQTELQIDLKENFTEYGGRYLLIHFHEREKHSYYSILRLHIVTNFNYSPISNLMDPINSLVQRMTANGQELDLVSQPSIGLIETIFLKRGNAITVEIESALDSTCYGYMNEQSGNDDEIQKVPNFSITVIVDKILKVLKKPVLHIICAKEDKLVMKSVYLVLKNNTSKGVAHEQNKQKAQPQQEHLLNIWPSSSNLSFVGSIFKPNPRNTTHLHEDRLYISNGQPNETYVKQNILSCSSLFSRPIKSVNPMIFAQIFYPGTGNIQRFSLFGKDIPLPILDGMELDWDIDSALNFTIDFEMELDCCKHSYFLSFQPSLQHVNDGIPHPMQHSHARHWFLKTDCIHHSFEMNTFAAIEKPRDLAGYKILLHFSLATVEAIYRFRVFITPNLSNIHHKLEGLQLKSPLINTYFKNISLGALTLMPSQAVSICEYSALVDYLFSRQRLEFNFHPMDDSANYTLLGISSVRKVFIRQGHADVGSVFFKAKESSGSIFCYLPDFKFGQNGTCNHLEHTIYHFQLLFYENTGLLKTACLRIRFQLPTYHFDCAFPTMNETRAKFDHLEANKLDPQALAQQDMIDLLEPIYFAPKLDRKVHLLNKFVTKSFLIPYFVDLQMQFIGLISKLNAEAYGSYSNASAPEVFRTHLKQVAAVLINVSSSSLQKSTKPRSAVRKIASHLTSLCALLAKQAKFSMILIHAIQSRLQDKVKTYGRNVSRSDREVFQLISSVFKLCDHVVRVQNESYLSIYKKRITHFSAFTSLNNSIPSVITEESNSV